MVGFNHLNAVIEELGPQGKVHIQWQPFELNPDMPAEGKELRAHVARKYGSSKKKIVIEPEPILPKQVLIMVSSLTTLMLTYCLIMPIVWVSRWI
ncbi:hypothetical protein [Alteromonas sp. 4B03]|uniref:hypothetical protein n=1 Tax=Alteromonas sp. 4B03 TaxID=2603817 RepID=UPI003D2CEE01